MNSKKSGKKKVRSQTNRTVKRSAYSILIQTNRKPSTVHHADYCARRLRQVIQDTFGTIEGLSSIVRFNWEGDELEDVLQTEPRVRYGIERGKNATNGGRIHGHVVVRFVHNSNFWLDKTLLEPILIEQWNAHKDMSFDKPMASLLVRVTRIMDPQDLEDYAMKGSKNKTTAPDFVAIEEQFGDQRAADYLRTADQEELEFDED